MNTHVLENPNDIPESGKGKKPKKPRNWWKIIKRLFILGFVLGLLALIFVTVYVIRATRDLPSLQALKDYSPAVMSRVHAGDGKLIAEYGIEKRVFVPIDSIPIQIQHALVASEDQRFYTHTGFDPKGFSRAMVANIKHLVKRERFEGGSTLTQQVAKHFLVGNERKAARKIREVFIARRIEKAMSKDKILELYLNDVYFGPRAYGIAGAALKYFNSPLDELTLGQMAYLSGIVKGPSNYQLHNNKEKAINRRNYVLTRMAADGYVTQEQAAEAKKEDLVAVKRLQGEDYLAAEYFVSEIRKIINKRYGEKQLNEGGLSIRTTLDTKMQLAARKALRRGLEMYDRRHGYRGALATIPAEADWHEELKITKPPRDIKPWKMAVVLNVDAKKADLGFLEGDNGTLALADIDWAGKALPDGRVGDTPKAVSDVVFKGDIILVEAKPKGENFYNLRQVPDVNGGIVAMDPHTGRVLALVGGYSFNQSQFNRVTQAYRQPGSAFKPFVYAAALDNGFTPVSQVLDAPFVIEHNDRDESCAELEQRGLVALGFGKADEDGQAEPENKLRAPKTISAQNTGSENLPEGEEEKECGPRYYKPANFNAGKFYGLSTLRLGLEKSRNAMTVRLANDIGMTVIGKYGRAFGIYDETKPELAWALGAGETTLLRLASAYASLVNGGKKVTPTLLDRVQDNKGRTVFLHDERTCPECSLDEWDFSRPPELPDEREVVLSAVTAYQMTSMLEGVVQRGTGRQMLRLGRPIAGKTGTTNDFKDAWFMGFSPDLVTGVYVGYDTPRSLGTETGAKAAGPIFRFFMKDVLASRPKTAFRIPEGVLLAPVDQVTGEASYIGAPNFIYEAFQPGTEPRLGTIARKINVGGGDTGFTDYDFGFENATNTTTAETDISRDREDEDADKAADADKTETDEAIKSEQKNTDVDEDTTDGEDAKTKTVVPPKLDEIAPKKLAPKKLAPKKPAPKKEDPKEDEVDLDDGLY